jgi:hypothetical protein
MFLDHRVHLLAGILTLLAHTPVLAQPGNVPRATGWGWLNEPRVNYEGITRAERSAAYATLAQLERVFHRVPEIANPKEFVVKVQYWGGSRPGWIRNGVASYRLRIWFFGRYGTNREKVNSEGCACIEVVINDAPTNMASTFEGRPIVLGEEPGPEVPGAFRTTRGLPDTDEPGFVRVIFTRGNESPWMPVSREAYLRAQIVGVEGPNGEQPAAMRNALQQTPYEKWMADAPVRKRDREAAAAQLRGIQTPEQIAKFIKDQEDTERQVGEQLRATDAADREQNKETSKRASAYGDGLRAQIEAMSPEERAQPARATKDGVIRPVGATDGVPMLTPKPGAWGVRRSPVEVHSIEVQMGGGTGDRLAYPETVKALRETFRKLDWAAIKAIVDRPD